MADHRHTPVRLPVVAMLATAVLVLLAALATGALMVGAWQQEAQPRVRLEPTVAVRARGPGLQSDPAAELEAIERVQRRRLNGTDWVDRESGVVRMPIERAMTLIVERGSIGPDALRARSPNAEEPGDD